jgi:hypothetical protein
MTPRLQFFYDFEEGSDEEESGPTGGGILTEAGEFILTEAGEFLIQE